MRCSSPVSPPLLPAEPRSEPRDEPSILPLPKEAFIWSSVFEEPWRSLGGKSFAESRCRAVVLLEGVFARGDTEIARGDAEIALGDAEIARGDAFGVPARPRGVEPPGLVVCTLAFPYPPPPSAPTCLCFRRIAVRLARSAACLACCLASTRSSPNERRLSSGAAPSKSC